MAAFDPKEWIGMGKVYKDAPPRVKRAAQHVLRMPSVLAQKLATEDTLHGLITSPLPLSHPMSLHPASLTAHFFSQSAPTVTAALLPIQCTHLSIPEAFIVNALVSALPQAWLNGAKSLRYAHLAENGQTTMLYPLGVVHWWKALTERRNPRAKWLQAREWVSKYSHQLRFPKCEVHAKQTLSYLSRLPWDTPQKISDDQPIHCLHRLLGPHWLSNSHINSKLILLSERSYVDAGDCCGVCFEPCEFTNILMAAYEDCDTTPQTKHTWLMSVGKSIARGTLALTVAHLGKVNGMPPWVAVGVDGTQRQFLYADSLSKKAPVELESAFRWLMKQFMSDELTVGEMKITFQIDGYNCGILAVNALEHHVFGTPLAGAMPGELALQRMIDFWQFLERIMARVRTLTLVYAHCSLLTNSLDRIGQIRRRDAIFFCDN